MSMMLCAKCGEYYDPVQYCYECDPFESAKNQELARKDAEIAAMITAMTSAITILEHPKMDGGEKRKAIEVLKAAQRKAIGGQNV